MKQVKRDTEREALDREARALTRKYLREVTRSGRNLSRWLDDALRDRDARQAAYIRNAVMRRCEELADAGVVLRAMAADGGVCAYVRTAHVPVGVREHTMRQEEALGMSLLVPDKGSWARWSKALERQVVAWDVYWANRGVPRLRLP